MEKFVAEKTVFEFADLRRVKMLEASFAGANFVGASLSESRAADCNFQGADFYWAEMQTFQMMRCNTEGARFPEKVEVAYGPKGVKPTEVKPVPLYRTAATPAEREKLTEAAREVESSRKSGS
jgi:uncharacterized protein YjbI with pentapeptide repeats